MIIGGVRDTGATNVSQLTIQDSLMIQRAVEGIISLTMDEAYAADIDGDGHITHSAALMLANWIAGIILKPPRLGLPIDRTLPIPTGVTIKESGSRKILVLGAALGITALMLKGRKR